MVAGTAIWGVGQGVYLAGDQCLGYGLLPDQNEASRFLGLTSVVSATGGIVGSGLFGGLLYLFGQIGKNSAGQSPDRPGYAYAGYAAMFSFAMCLSAASFVVLCFINPTSPCQRREDLINCKS